ncbi:MAG: hypothetical protein AAF431_12895 [Pseudomonadota bacterium]
MSTLQQLRYLITPLALGCLFAVAPLLLNLIVFVAFVLFEIVLFREHGFSWLAAKRVSLFFAIVFAAYFAPLKYVDQFVIPSEFDFSENGYSSLLASDRISLSFPSSYSKNAISLTEKRVRLKSFIEEIEQQTGLEHVIYYCGTGANVLFGGHPILGIQFKERVPNKINNENGS